MVERGGWGVEKIAGTLNSRKGTGLRSFRPRASVVKIYAPIGSRHKHGANVVFADGHIEYGKQKSWNEPTAQAMRRWNRDFQPHLKE